MSPRAFVVLLVLTVVALIGAIGVVAVQPKLAASEKIDGDPMFGALNKRIADLKTLKIQTPAYTASWELRDSKWVAADHGNYPAKDGIVAAVVAALAAMTQVEAKTDNPDWYQYIQVADLGANAPAPTTENDQASPAGIRLIASAANGDVLADTIVGNVSSTISAAHGRGGTFVRNANDPQSWLVEGTLTVPYDLGDWFSSLVTIPATNIASVAVLTGDKTVFEANKPDPKSGFYQLVQLDPSAGPTDSVANDTTIHNLAASLVDVTVEDARALESITPGPTARTDRFKTADGLEVDVTLADADGGTWAIIKATAPDGTDAAKTAAALNAAAGQWALRLGAVQMANLEVDVSRLIQPPAANNGATVTMPGGGPTVPLVSPGPGSPLPPGFGQGGQAPPPAPAQ